MVLASPASREYGLVALLFCLPLIFSVGIGLLFVLLFPSIWLHMQAHAVVARKLRFEVFRVEVLGFAVHKTVEQGYRYRPSGGIKHFGFVIMLPTDMQAYRKRMLWITSAGPAASLALVLIIFAILRATHAPAGTNWIATIAMIPMLDTFFGTHQGGFRDDTSMIEFLRGPHYSEPQLLAEQIIATSCARYDITQCPEWMFEIATAEQPDEPTRRWVCRYYAHILLRQGKYRKAIEVIDQFGEPVEEFDQSVISFASYMLDDSERGKAYTIQETGPGHSFYNYLNRAFYSFHSDDRVEAHYRLRDARDVYQKEHQDSGRDISEELGLFELARRKMNLPPHHVHARHGELAGSQNASPEPDA